MTKDRERERQEKNNIYTEKKTLFELETPKIETFFVFLS